jgi:rhamnosyltransferase
MQMIKSPRHRTAAIITTYKPDSGFLNRFSETADFCDLVIVVDNTPGRHPFTELGPKFVVIQDGVNKGLGTALNIGIERAKRDGIEGVFLFDQDSSPTAALLDSLLGSVQAANSERVCVGPLHIDDQQPGSAPEHLSDDRAAGLKRVTCLATSGMTFRLGAVSPTDSFSTDLFLDFVDFEWCWRMKNQGWTFYKSTVAVMPHRLGLAQRRLLGLTYHVPSPYRHYYQFRDTLKLIGWRYTPIYSKIRLGGILPLKLIAYPFIMDRGQERLHWMLRGIADRARGITGIGAAGELLN